MKNKIAVFFILIALALSSLWAQDNTLSQEGTITIPVVEYKADGLKDPFKGYGEEAPVTTSEQKIIKPLPVLTVQGLVWGSKIPQVIINNMVLKVGDTLKVGSDTDEVKITKIDKDGVEVFYAGRTYSVSSPASQAVPKLQQTEETQNTGGRNE